MDFSSLFFERFLFEAIGNQCRDSVCNRLVELGLIDDDRTARETFDFHLQI